MLWADAGTHHGVARLHAILQVLAQAHERREDAAHAGVRLRGRRRLPCLVQRKDALALLPSKLGLRRAALVGAPRLHKEGGACAWLEAPLAQTELVRLRRGAQREALHEHVDRHARPCRHVCWRPRAARRREERGLAADVIVAQRACVFEGLRAIEGRRGAGRVFAQSGRRWLWWMLRCVRGSCVAPFDPSGGAPLQPTWLP
eukprot:6088359-Prymnesium_polylepis.4